MSSVQASSPLLDRPQLPSYRQAQLQAFERCVHAGPLAKSAFEDLDLTGLQALASPLAWSSSASRHSSSPPCSETAPSSSPSPTPLLFERDAPQADPFYLPPAQPAPSTSCPGRFGTSAPTAWSVPGSPRSVPGFSKGDPFALGSSAPTRRSPPPPTFGLPPSTLPPARPIVLFQPAAAFPPSSEPPPRLQNGERRCFRCLRTDHTVSKCPTLPPKRHVETRPCNHCGEIGHLKAVCPLLRPDLKMKRRNR